MAQEKFRESLHNASTSMHHLLENDVELISQLAVFSESLMTYYQQCAEVMQDLTTKLYEKYVTWHENIFCCYLTLSISLKCLFSQLRKAEAMNRPKKTFIATTLSDLNIDTMSIGSNDHMNNNMNGARLSNFDRFKATSSSNLSYKHSNSSFNNNNNTSSNHKSNVLSGNQFSRTSKMYSSQSNLSSTSGSRYQVVNNNNNSNVNNNHYNINSPKNSSSGDTEKWLQAWSDNNNNYRAPSYHQNQANHSFEKCSIINNSRTTANTFNRSDSMGQKNAINNLYSNNDPFDPFEDSFDPWSGTIFHLFFYYVAHTNAHKM
jgi:hypothetical protein